jgi:hypothetical protein
MYRLLISCVTICSRANHAMPLLAVGCTALPQFWHVRTAVQHSQHARNSHSQPQQSPQSFGRTAQLPCTSFQTFQTTAGGDTALKCSHTLVHFTNPQPQHMQPRQVLAAALTCRGSALRPRQAGQRRLPAVNTLLGTCLPTPRRPARADRCMLKHPALSYTVHMPMAPAACPRQRARPGPLSMRTQPSKQPIRETSTRRSPAWPVAASPASTHTM